MSRIRIPLLLLGALACSACAGKGSPLAAPSELNGLPAEGPILAMQAGEVLSDVVTIEVDPSGTSAHVIGAGSRSASSQPPQSISYDLDLDKFLTTNNFRISKVDYSEKYTALAITIQFRHPFKAPNFANPITAGNRADLGFTGRLLILADQNHLASTIPGEGEYRWDDKYVIDPDGFAEVGDLLRTQGLTNNLFPYFLLVDEALDNRIDVSNGGDMTGNYDAPGGGWQQANAGAPTNQWTGYDYVHQGQTVERTIRLTWADLRASGLQFKMALLAKYTDPRGAADYLYRMPRTPVDVTKFAYRLPQAALDVSQCTWCNTLEIMGSPNVNHAEIHLRDWDAAATEAATADLSGEADVSLVRPDTAGFPTVELVGPAFATPVLLNQMSGTGIPGDELRYGLDFTNTANIDGESWGFYRAVDPEGSASSFATTHYGVDPNTLAASAARALLPRTVMPVRVRASTSANWSKSLEGEWSQQSAGRIVPVPSGGYLLTEQYFSERNDLDTADCLQAAPWGGSRDFAVLALDGSGNSFARLIWPDPSYQTVGTATQDAAGNTYVAFTWTNPAQDNSPFPCDVDPGPGVDTRICDKTSVVLEKLNPQGQLLWARDFGGAFFQQTSGWAPGAIAQHITIGTDGTIYLSGNFEEVIDLDPTAGTSTHLAGFYGDFFLTVYDTNGNWLWGLGEGNAHASTITAGVAHADNSVAFAGTFWSSGMDFDPGPGEVNLDAGTNSAGFLITYTPTGGVVSAKAWQSPTSPQGEATADYFGESASGRSVMSGTFSGDIDFDPGVGTAIRSSGAYKRYRMYTLSLASGGAFEWVNVYDLVDPQASQSSAASGFAVDATGGAITVGIASFGRSLDADPGPGVSVVDGVFWTRVDAAGNFDWARQTDFEWFPNGLLATEDDRLLLHFDATPGSIVIPPSHTLTKDGRGSLLVQLNADGTW